jgi:uncharacterized protein (UPF0262 family)
MPLTAIVLDEGTLQRGSEDQRAEWDANSRALLDEAACNFEESASLRVTVDERQFVLRFENGTGAGLGEVVVDYEPLSKTVVEYLDIVRQMSTADSLNQMEALDMAKKVTHDRAGRLLKRALRDYGFDLETSRRLFTLLLSLKVDTTRLPGLRGHRRLR